MITELKPYPEMKDSGVEWLGEVPVHWEVVRNGRQFSQRNETGHPNLPILEVSLSNGVRVRNFEGSNRKQIMSDRSMYKRIVKGDIAYNMMRMWQGSVGVAPVDGLVSPAYVVARPLFRVDSRYFENLFRTRVYMTEVDKYSRGIVKDRNRLYWEDFKQMVSPCPSQREQTAIARFLDHVTDRIDRYIRAKEKLIKLLKEQQQVIVHEAVTGRFDVRTGQPYPAYKDSGVEWLGAVPEDWEVRRLGQIGNVSKGRGGSKEDEAPQGIPCVRYGDLYTTHDYFIFRARSCVSSEIATQYTPIRFGDVLFAASGETIEEIGKSAVNLVRSEICCGGDIVIFRSKREVDAKYIGYTTGCAPSAYQKATMGRGITVMHVYSNQLKYLGLALPSLSEQTTIARFLDKTTSKIDNSIARAQRQIDLLREYRTRLIADVVTGKLDIREAATGLSHEEDKPTSINGSDYFTGREEYVDTESSIDEGSP